MTVSPEISRFMSNARVRLPGAADSAIQLELFAALKEFFINTNSWREEIQFQVEPSLQEYHDNPEAYTFSISAANGAVVRLIGTQNEDGRWVEAIMPSPGIIVLGKLPIAAEIYTSLVTLTVSDPVTPDGYPYFPEWALSVYPNEILDGVLGRMMGQIAKPYTNPPVAVVHMRKFRQGMAMARVATKRQNIYAGQPWRFPKGFAQ